MKLALALSLSASMAAKLPPMPGLDVNELVSRSHLIVAGHFISSVDDGPTIIETYNGPIPARRKTVDVRVSHVLKGTAGSLVKVGVVQAVSPQRDYAYFGSLDANRFRVIFFRRAASGYVLTSPYYPSVIAAPRDPIAGASPVAQVAAFVTAVLKAPGASQQDRKMSVFTLGLYERRGCGGRPPDRVCGRRPHCPPRGTCGAPRSGRHNSPAAGGEHPPAQQAEGRMERRGPHPGKPS